MQRVLTQAQFQAVMQAGTVGRTPHFVLHAWQWPPGGARLQGILLFADGVRYGGVLVPKRWARRAVTRSTIKRQMRAVAAERAAHMPLNTAIVIRLRAEFSRKHFVSATSDVLRQAVRSELLQLFDQARWAGPAAAVTRPASGTMQGAS